MTSTLSSLMLIQNRTNVNRNAYDTIRVSLFIQQIVIFHELVFCSSNVKFLRVFAIKKNSKLIVLDRITVR